MTVPKEVEIKLELPPENLPRLRSVPLLRALKKPARRETQVSVYFDTDKYKLRRKGLMLRVRRVGDRHIQTIKATRNSGATNGSARSRAKCRISISRRVRRSSQC